MFDKENFLRTKLVSYLQQLNPNTPAKWGKMNVQQMIEHMIDHGVRISNGSAAFDKIITPAERLPKMREFLLANKPFRENTKSPLLGESPRPLKYTTVQAAINGLQMELIAFFEHFDRQPGGTTRNPIFGDLNFEENVALLYKHALHHLRQFGVTPLEA